MLCVVCKENHQLEENERGERVCKGCGALRMWCGCGHHHNHGTVFCEEHQDVLETTVKEWE